MEFIAGTARQKVWKEKSSTPGKKPAETVGDAFEDIERHCQVLDVNPFSGTPFPDVQTAVLAQFSKQDPKIKFVNMAVQLDRKFLPQWHSKYFSQIMPFEIPRMVSGPDYPRTERWRRRPESPLVSTTDFTRTFARRVELQIANSWTAIPIVRSVWQKFTIENTAAATGCFRRAVRGAAGMEVGQRKKF